MTGTGSKSDWDPGAYDRFRGLRLRPAIDLLRAVPALPPGPVIDLGCGAGAAGQALSDRGQPLIGVDRSPNMLAEARASGHYQQLVEADVGTWSPEAPAALIFSNAALQWLDDHDSLMPRLARALTPGGTLAVQMPPQNNAPSHRLWPTLAEEFWGASVTASLPAGSREPALYHRLLRPLGQVSVWETAYYQVLPASDVAHPVRLFTEASYARPLLQALDPAMQARLISAYEAAIEKTYPRAADGTVLFPFRRLFFTVTVSA